MNRDILNANIFTDFTFVFACSFLMKDISILFAQSNIFTYFYYQNPTRFFLTRGLEFKKKD